MVFMVSLMPELFCQFTMPQAFILLTTLNKYLLNHISMHEMGGAFSCPDIFPPIVLFSVKATHTYAANYGIDYVDSLHI
jgi:hypothetical protein